MTTSSHSRNPSVSARHHQKGHKPLSYNNSSTRHQQTTHFVSCDTLRRDRWYLILFCASEIQAVLMTHDHSSVFLSLCRARINRLLILP